MSSEYAQECDGGGGKKEEETGESAGPARDVGPAGSRVPLHVTLQPWEQL